MRIQEQHDGIVAIQSEDAGGVLFYYRNTWSKDVRNSCGPDFQSSCFSYPLYKLRVPGG
jgi:hypothetical protein